VPLPQTTPSVRFPADDDEWRSTYCLRHGGECVYSDEGPTRTPTPSGSEGVADEPWAEDYSGPAPVSLLDATPKDPFVGIDVAVEMPYKSRPLFQLCELLP
jgi:hypothetical protein